MYTGILIDLRLKNMGWYKVVFNGGQIESLAGVAFIEDFASVLRKNLMPDVALLHLIDEPRSQSTYFLTPAAAFRFGKLLEKYDPEPCDQPDIDDVYLCVGIIDSLEMLLARTRSANN